MADDASMSDSDEQMPQQKTRQKIVLSVVDTQYQIVKYVGRKIMKWNLTQDPECADWDIWWTDSAVTSDQLQRMKQHQKINHFPGMYCITRKNTLAKTLMKMRKKFETPYNFFPQTWILPHELNDLKTFYQINKVYFIVKPEAGCQGRGIFITKNLDFVQNTEKCVVQRYLSEPLLIDNLKFDLRIYALVTGCDYLRVFIYTEGLVRFATEEYLAPSLNNIQNAQMHLTNYAINKDSEKFVSQEDQSMNQGHKRTLSSVFEMLKAKGHDIDTLWTKIKSIIAKTLCAAQPTLKHQYNTCQPNNYQNNMCFEILGFDIFINSRLKPYLLEVNHTPSFNTDSTVDSYVKCNLIQDTLQLLNVTQEQKMKIMLESSYPSCQRRDEQKKRIMTAKNFRISGEEKAKKTSHFHQERDRYENANLGGFERLLPAEDDRDYDEYIRFANQLQEEQAGTNIRRFSQKKQKLVDDQDQPKVTRNEDISKIYSNTSKWLKQFNLRQTGLSYRKDQSPNQKSSQAKINALNSHDEQKREMSSQKERIGQQQVVKTHLILRKEKEDQRLNQKKMEIAYKELVRQQISNENEKIRQLIRNRNNSKNELVNLSNEQSNNSRLKKLYSINNRNDMSESPKLIKIVYDQQQQGSTHEELSQSKILFNGNNNKKLNNSYIDNKQMYKLPNTSFEAIKLKRNEFRMKSAQKQANDG